MKNIFSLSILALSIMVVFASCDKKMHSYTCNCEVNQYLTPGSGTNPATSFVIDDATTNNAQSKCDMHMDEILNHSGQKFTCTYR